jgi:hypothetical protein
METGRTEVAIGGNTRLFHMKRGSGMRRSLENLVLSEERLRPQRVPGMKIERAEQEKN